VRYSEFGSMGYKVSALGFGAMNLPGVPYEQAEAALHYALDQGINYIDTAAAYRNSEEILGNAISSRRKEFFLATKTAQRSYEGAKAEIERSLERLQTDTIDLLQIHYVNYVSEYKDLMGENGAYKAVMEAKEEGLVRHIGITGHRPELLARWIRSGSFEQALFHLNLGQPFAAHDLIPALKEMNMGRVSMKPLSGGFFQPVEKALRYPYSQDVHVVISGMVSVEEVKQNLAAFREEVAIEEQLELEAMAEQLGAHDCRRCNYCSCPIGIPIPDVMISSKLREVFGLLPKGDAFYQKHKEKLFSCADYEPCREKPLCEEKCPYQLPMSAVVRESVSYFNSPAKKD
jgi:uncharacterized protein